ALQRSEEGGKGPISLRSLSAILPQPSMAGASPYLGFVSEFWAVEDVITRSRTASGHVDGAVLACTIMLTEQLLQFVTSSLETTSTIISLCLLCCRPTSIHPERGGQSETEGE